MKEKFRKEYNSSKLDLGILGKGETKTTILRKRITVSLRP